MPDLILLGLFPPFLAELCRGFSSWGENAAVFRVITSARGAQRVPSSLVLPSLRFPRGVCSFPVSEGLLFSCMGFVIPMGHP